MFRPRKKTEDSLFSLTKNCEMLIKKTHTKPQKKLEFKLTQPIETFSFTLSYILDLDSKSMIGLTNLEVCNCLFNIQEYNIKFELYTDLVDEFAYTESKDDLEEILGFSDISPEHLRDKRLGPCFFIAYGKLTSEKRHTDVQYFLIKGYARPPNRTFECYFRTVVLDEDDIQLV